MRRFKTVLILLVLAFTSITFAKENNQKDKMKSSAFSGMKLRLIGPGITSGRIIDLAVKPNDHTTYYVASASGGVWKTTNNGITFKPIFDKQHSYSIGCVTIDPNNYNVVWVGTGENNSQRSVSYGDGVYKSLDGGESWENMGLKNSKNIGKIIVDPKNSEIVYVAAFGPLWGPGGDRGLYKTTDGGRTWNRVLKISENTGVSDIAMDPRDPNVIYATSYQRRRHVWTLIDGGPEARIYKTTDAGKTWNKLTNGLPGGDLGRIGIVISPVNPDYVFALIEGSKSKVGFYKSTDRGSSWKKVSAFNPGSAQYYQELICDPYDVDKIYSTNTITKVTLDGGKTWKALGNKHRHVDDHALWIDSDNTDHILIGGDGGLYETFDGGKNWHHFANLPVAQFYRISCDNTLPFYYVYGGTQDNNSWGCPSQTTNAGGILNEDWFQLVGGDGYQPRSDPDNPNIIYCQWQYGNLMRYDRKTGEQTYIQPQPKKGEENRWNWDSPVIISPHKSTRIYFACNRLYQTDDRGNSWKAISPDLTRQINRNQLPIMGKVWSPEAVAKNASTSLYGNIVALSESPVKEGLIYVGTDDGLIQVTNDDGTNWTKIEHIGEVPDTTYVSDIFASNFDENVVFATLNNHKREDFKPYVLKSTDKGKTWFSIAGNLPDNQPTWTIYQDFKDKNLLFVGTEFGLYFTIDGGKKWIQLKSGLPTIAVRDLEIQKRESDLVVGTFGRGIYVLDNYSPLRFVNDTIFNENFHLFPIKNALMFFQNESRAKEAQGEDFFRTKNPPYGAVFTYYMKEAFKTKKGLRKEEEKKIRKEDKPYHYPSWNELRAEDREQPSYLIFEITDSQGNFIRRLIANPKAGISRIVWDLTYASKTPVNKSTKTSKHGGYPVLPGTYQVTVYKNINGRITKISAPVVFKVNRLKNSTLPAPNEEVLAKFRTKLSRLMQAVFGTDRAISEIENRIALVKVALKNTPQSSLNLLEKIRNIELNLANIKVKLSGNPTISKRNGNQTPSIHDRLDDIIYSTAWSSSAPTLTAQKSYNIIAEDFVPILDQLRKLSNIDLNSIEKKLQKMDAPWTPGRIPYWKP